MGRIYVCNGAQLQCSMGSSTSVLVVLPDRRILLDGQPQANIMDFQPNTNIQSFGLCFSPANPMVMMATAAHFGVLTPMPCRPNTTKPWVRGEEKLLLKNSPALCQDDTLQCAWQGTISIVDCGQGRGQGAFPLAKENVNGTVGRSETQVQKLPDELVVKDAYWEKDGMKIRLLPHQKKVKLIVVLQFKYGTPSWDQDKAELRLKFSIPGTIFPQHAEMVIKGSDVKKCKKTNEGYLYTIENFTSDLAEVGINQLREVV